jgi:hypothetical protein
MTDHRLRREPIATRIDRGALETIERLAEQRRTTPAQVARMLSALLIRMRSVFYPV